MTKGELTRDLKAVLELVMGHLRTGRRGGERGTEDVRFFAILKERGREDCGFGFVV